jgi:hypothetical protein
MTSSFKETPMNHRQLKLAARALCAATALLAFSLPSHALVRSADSIAMCFDAEGGLGSGKRLISWGCSLGDNQKFWMEWTGNFNAEGLRPGKLRVGDFCVVLGKSNNVGEVNATIEEKDSVSCKSEASNWFGQNLGGHRYRLMVRGRAFCATLTNDVVQHGKPIYFTGCEENTESYDTRMRHLRQFWWLEQ